ncbi:c-type cytochrome biogenesis protein CcmI (plasmid) [Paracoccus sp. TK19116]|uniref:C-type cytochrome biogenesis protein CcmI n=1 Tax=Paracoccus albicereus TaxID=2922394 RepID=A0ABT1MLA4_9RHOB|nr:c-type cytochrome biogenesis protein CcmI [Paracoccus albicereus]MCQ0969075.1 c-type cytochrome biogenesis protein CcmI [Paracoccus albicereus]
MFWFFAAAMLAVVALALLAPFRRRAATSSEPAAAYDLRVYRDQLNEVENDLARGVIAPEEAERLRIEIGRKVLDADRRMAETTGSTRHGGLVVPALAVALALLGAVALYWREGAPGFPDLPLSERLSAAQRAYDARPTQAEAEAAAQLPEPEELDPEFAALMDRLRETVQQRPDDPQGLTLLAQNEARIGNFAAARDAQERLVALRGDQVSAEDLAQLAALMIDQAGGIITPESEDMLSRALQKDARNARARYMAGMLQVQNGRPDRAFPIWARLLEEGPPDAPWIAPIRAVIPDLAWLAGEPDYAMPDSTGGMPALPGPAADAMAATEDMTPEDRQQMIEGMVAQLESRLATEGGAPEEWARLIASLGILGRTDHATAIWGEAQARFGGTPEAIAPIREAAEQAGITE